MESCLDISVVIPYYKSSDTIQRTIDSILNQSYLPKEIIIIDDCSNTDEDYNKLKELEYHNLIKVIFLRSNTGPGGARNIGIDNAKGKFIAFLDSDDVWKKNKLEIQHNFMENNALYLSGHLTSIFKEKEINKTGFKKVNKYSQLLKNQFATRTVMMINNDKYRFKSDKRYSEDFLLWTQIVLDGNKTAILNKTLAYSFKENYGAGGLTGNINNMYFGAIDAYRILEKDDRITSLQFVLLVLCQSFKQIFRLSSLQIRKIKK